MIYYLEIIIMTVIGAGASFFLKKSANYDSLKGLLKNVNLYIGGLLYFLSALINISVLQYVDYSIVLPLTSITYVWTLFISKKYLCEIITSKKIIGVLLIIIGAIIISLS